MFSQFTDRARKVMGLARQEAGRSGDEFIGTEHILLALVKEGTGVGASVLENLDGDLDEIRKQIEAQIKPVPGKTGLSQFVFTHFAKKTLEFAMEEAQKLDPGYVGTEHLLLGLIREKKGLASQVLMKLGLNLSSLRKEVCVLLGSATDVIVSELQAASVRNRTQTPPLAHESRRRPLPSQWNQYYLLALDDDDASMRTMAIEILASRPAYEIVHTLLSRLRKPEYQNKADILAAFGNIRPLPVDLVGEVIPFLRDKSLEIRWAANGTLAILTGRSFEFQVDAEEEVRETGVLKWEQWWAERDERP